FAEHPSGHLGEPEVASGKDGHDGTADEHVMEVRDDKVAVVDLEVERHVGEIDTGDAANNEEADETEGKFHRSGELDGAAPNRCNPRPDFHACRDGDDHGGEREV